MENTKKIVGVAIIIIMLSLVGYVTYSNVKDSKNTDPSSNTTTNTSNVAGTPAASTSLQQEATPEQKCEICRMIIKSGTKSPCMEALKCKQ